MKPLILGLASSCLVLSVLSCSSEQMDTKQMDKEQLEAKMATYRATIKEFGGALKGELKAAMTTGGPLKAIEVCKTKAPKISAEFSQKVGFEITRTSLKARNTDNAPDAWEEAVLKQFEERKAAGEDPKQLEFIEEVKVDGQNKIRYMKAIRTAGVCLDCHGSEISEDIQAKLNTLYPNDKAKGFEVGDLRGAFSITSTQ
jgi:hypothetical protein